MEAGRGINQRVNMRGRQRWHSFPSSNATVRKEDLSRDHDHDHDHDHDKH